MNRDLRALGKALVLLLVLALGGYLIQHFGLAEQLNERWFDRHVRNHGAAGVLLFVAVGGLFTAAGLPRQLIAFLGGYGFGWWQGALISTLAALLGCALAFGYARWLGREFVERRFGARIVRLERILAHKPLQMALLLRLLPVGSNLLTNLAAGICQVPILAFLAGSLLGYLPQMVIFALTGSGVTLGSQLQVGTSILLMIGSTLLGLHMLRQIRRERRQSRLDSDLAALETEQEQ